MDLPRSQMRPSTGFFMVTLIATMIGLAILFVALETMLGIRAPSGVASVLPTLVAAMVTGDRYAKAHDAIPEGGTAWRFSVLVTMLQMGLTLMILAGLMSVDPEVQAIMESGSVATLVVGFLVVITLIVLLMTRFFLTMGAKSQLRNRTRRKG